MAVQAQYPSNVLLLNSRSGQDGHHDQPHHHHHLLYDDHHNNNGTRGGNSGKRGREVVEASQVQRQQQQGSSSSFMSLLSQIKQQRDEINHLLQSQGEHLRRALADKSHTHYRALLAAAEDSAARRLREKDHEVQKAARRNAELEARAAQLAAEAQLWQAKARAQEAAAASLQAQLHQAMMASAADEGACAGVSSAAEGQADDEESAFVDPDRVVIVSAAGRRKCRGCGRRVASVVVLPCRHLCICSECDALFRACPVCLTIKNSTVEVYLS